MPGKNTTSNAEEARWLMNNAAWGVSSFLVSTGDEQEQQPMSALTPFADSDEGRIFFYLMGSREPSTVSLTVSEASLTPSFFEIAGCGEKGDADAEDPRCAKLTLTGTVSPCSDDSDTGEEEPSSDCVEVGKAALFARHPQMEYWPPSHRFTVHEMLLEDAWMIANYGGGGAIETEKYYSVGPVHHPGGFPGKHQSVEEEEVHVGFKDYPDPPSWDEKVARARWVVYKSWMTTVSTISVHLSSDNQDDTTKLVPWGNIRSTVDGGLSFSESTGLPVFYLPSPDPTSIDINSDPTISLVFTEAALTDRLNPDNLVCGGSDAGDPTCAQVLMQGKAVAIDDDDEAMDIVESQFAVRHPLAPWLSAGGAHTGGKYYTIDIKSIEILDWYGGATRLDVDEYLSYDPPLINEENEKNEAILMRRRALLRGSTV